VAKNGEEGARPKTTFSTTEIGNAKKGKEQILEIQCGMEEVLYLEIVCSHNNSILKFIKDVAS
jgi:hypothetical protein